MNILYQDNHLIAVDKEAGLLTQQDHSGAPCLMDMVKAYLKTRYNKPGDVFLGLIHRLDRPVSGVVLFARTSKGASRLSEQFRSGLVEKYYVAVTSCPPETLPDRWIELTQHLRRSRGYSAVLPGPAPGAVEARLRYRIIDGDGRSCLVLVRLLTGKKHQIRAQLASCGLAVVGDSRYGSPAAIAGEGILLHALAMGFHHPVTRDRHLVCSPLPHRFREYRTIAPDREERLMALIEEDRAAHTASYQSQRQYSI
jgi:23S rRNA pseudouridine1911/1915/1917 synthase